MNDQVGSTEDLMHQRLGVPHSEFDWLRLSAAEDIALQAG